MMTLTFPTSDGLDLFGHHWPAKNTKAVMTLVHGFGEHGGRYADMAAHLNAHNISVVSADLRGYGRSPGPRGVVRDYDDYRADLSALMAGTRKLYPDTPHVLFGHSMGGGIVLDYGLTHRNGLRAIIASAPLIALVEPPSGFLRRLAKLIGGVFPKAALSQPIDGAKISTLPKEQAAYEADPLNHGRLGLRLAGAMIAAGENIAARAGEWETPLLLFHARQDELTQFEASENFAGTARNVSFHAMDDVAHEMHNDTSRAQVYDLICNFVLTHAED